MKPEPLGKTLERVEKFISKMEFRYECPSDYIHAEVRAGHIHETEEIRKWLRKLDLLTDLRQKCLDTGGQIH